MHEKSSKQVKQNEMGHGAAMQNSVHVRRRAEGSVKEVVIAMERNKKIRLPISYSSERNP